MNYFVTAISTDSGKTVVSAILCEFLRADYWKPVQAGHPTDSDTIRSLFSDSRIVVHPESYLLKTPASPHAAASVEGIRIDMEQVHLPVTRNDLVIEGAGGCLVPLNDHDFVIDIAARFDCDIILVSNIYLGSINHTLLTFEALVKRRLPIAGIVFNGTPNAETENIILKHTKLPCLLRIAPEERISREKIKGYATKLNENWNQRIRR